MANKKKELKTDPTELKNAQNLWENFTKATTVSVIITVIVLILMALFLL